MITNERQYQITKEKADRFARALDEYDTNKQDRENVSNRLLQLERSAMKAQLTVLRDEIENYERGKD